MELEATVVPSVEETPSVQPENGAEPEHPQEPETPTENLYDLPDGRKLTGEQVKSEYENLLKDYTQKSQRLATFERGTAPKHITDQEVPEWQKPDYVPKSWAEVIEIGKAQALEEIRKSAEAEETRSKEVAQLVDSQIAEIRAQDKNLDENALFLHANKWGFRDLKAAHANMVAMKQATLDAEQRTVKNLKTRAADPVSGTPAVPTPDSSIDPRISQKYGSAIEYFRSLHGK